MNRMGNWKMHDAQFREIGVSIAKQCHNKSPEHSLLVFLSVEFVRSFSAASKPWSFLWENCRAESDDWAWFRLPLQLFFLPIALHFLFFCRRKEQGRLFHTCAIETNGNHRLRDSSQIFTLHEMGRAESRSQIKLQYICWQLADGEGQ